MMFAEKYTLEAESFIAGLEIEITRQEQ